MGNIKLCVDVSTYVILTMLVIAVASGWLDIRLPDFSGGMKRRNPNIDTEPFSIYPPKGISDIEQVQWNEPGNMAVNDPNDPKMNNHHSKWPGHEGFYNNDNQVSAQLEDSILSSVISDDVKQNHATYISDTLSTQPIAGASHMGVMDNFNPVNKPWGLPRSILFQHSGAMSDARQVQSETRAQVSTEMQRGNRYLI